MSSGYYKSKEVYKYTETSNGRKLVPIRGLYVSGLHTEPLYMDHLISIHDFSSTPTVIADYTEISENVYDSVLNIVGIGASALTITNYTIASANLPNDDVLNIVGFDQLPINVQSYTQESDNVTDSVLNIVGLSVSSMGITEYPYAYETLPPEHLITINAFTSNATVITDVNE